MSGDQNYFGKCCADSTTFLSEPSPRVMPVNMPFPRLGLVTFAVLDDEGNVSVMANQDPNEEEASVAEPVTVRVECCCTARGPLRR